MKLDPVTQYLLELEKEDRIKLLTRKKERLEDTVDEYEEKLEQLRKKYETLKDRYGSVMPPGAKKLMQSVKDEMDDVHQKILQGHHELNKIAQGLKDGGLIDKSTIIGKAIHNVNKTINDTTAQAVKGAHQIQTGEGDLEYTIKHELPGGMTGTAIGVAAVLTAAVVAGNRIYKKFFSKAAQACKNAPDKDKCLREFKNKAVQAEISQLQKAKKYCQKSKNPKQCVSKLDQEIQKNKAKMK